MAAKTYQQEDEREVRYNQEQIDDLEHKRKELEAGSQLRERVTLGPSSSHCLLDIITPVSSV